MTIYPKFLFERSRGPLSWPRLGLGLSTLSLASLVATMPANAHVKWFAPYVVGAAPAPLTDTLANGWFWLGLILVVAFFAATVLAEQGRVGVSVTGRLTASAARSRRGPTISCAPSSAASS